MHHVDASSQRESRQTTYVYRGRQDREIKKIIIKKFTVLFFNDGLLDRVGHIKAKHSTKNIKHYFKRQLKTIKHIDNVDIQHV